MKGYLHFFHFQHYAFIALINFAICHDAHGERSSCDDYDYILRGDSSNLIFEEFAGTPNRSRMTGSFTSVQEGLPGFKLRATTSSKMRDYYFATAAEYAMAGEQKYIHALQTGVFSAGRKSVPRVPGFDYKSGYYRIYRPNQTIPGAVYTGQMFAPHQIAIVDPSEHAWGITPLPRSFQNGTPVFEEGAASVFGPAHPLGRTAPKREFPLSKPGLRPSSTGSRPGIRSPIGSCRSCYSLLCSCRTCDRG